MLPIIKQRKIWFIFSGTLVVISIVLFFWWGLKLGIDFTGGSLLEVEFSIPRPNNQEIISALTPLELSNVTVQPIGEAGVILRFKEISEETHQKIISTLKEKFKQTINSDEGVTMEIKILEEKRFDSIGPTIGQELRQKTIWAIILANLGMILYITWAFRKVSKPVASWKYGLSAILALFHDIIITVGFFTVLGKFYDMEVNASFIAALLTILGYSVNDTIVVFDRTRENLIHHIGEDFEKIVEMSVNQTLTRSINTSLTVLLTLFTILIFGGQTIRDFVLALIIGITFGTYSSIFLASPMLVLWHKIKVKS